MLVSKLFSCATLVALLVSFVACAAPEAGDPTIAPRPFTAEQIRKANPPGTEMVFRVEPVDAPAFLRTTRFLSEDGERTVMESSLLDEQGAAVGEVARGEASWEDLRDHATFAAALTERREGKCTTPAGEFDCWIYTVLHEQDEQLRTDVFYFAKELPGPPVLHETRVGDRLTMRMTLVDRTSGR